MSAEVVLSISVESSAVGWLTALWDHSAVTIDLGLGRLYKPWNCVDNTMHLVILSYIQRSR